MVARGLGYFLSRLLKFARLRAKLTQREIAEKIGIAQPSVVGWENGERAVSEETVAKVARALGHTDVEEFLCIEIVEWQKWHAAQLRKQREQATHEHRSKSESDRSP